MPPSDETPAHNTITPAPDLVVEMRHSTEVLEWQGLRVGWWRGVGWKNQAVAFSPNGKRIATGATERPGKIWDAETGVEVRCPFLCCIALWGWFALCPSHILSSLVQFSFAGTLRGTNQARELNLTEVETELL